MIPQLSPMNPVDAAVPFTFDFSKLIASGDSIANIVGVTSLPSNLTIGGGEVVTGARAGCAVQFTLGGGAAVQVYTVTVEIHTASGMQLARSARVPVELV